MRKFLIFLAILTLGGCALFSKELDKAAEGAGKLVTFYCSNISDPVIREQFRTAVNQHAAPNSVSVTCAVGGPVLIVSPTTSTQP